MIQQAEKVDFFQGMDEEQRSAGRPPEADRYFSLIAERHQGRWRGEVSSVKTEVADPSTLTRMVRDMAQESGADLVGVAEVTQAFVYKGRHVAHKYAVSLGMEMDYARLATTPSPESLIEIARVYYELGESTIRLAEYIRSLGYDAHSHHPLGGGAVLLIPHAIAAGLGELGRISLVISREFGPRFRLGCVTTDIPLLLDKPVDLGAAEFCRKCQACLRACPAGAIPQDQRQVRGIEKYTIDGASCRLHCNQPNGCAICIKVCVFNELAHRGKWLKGGEAAL